MNRDRETDENTNSISKTEQSLHISMKNGKTLIDKQLCNIHLYRSMTAKKGLRDPPEDRLITLEDRDGLETQEGDALIKGGPERRKNNIKDTIK